MNRKPVYKPAPFTPDDFFKLFGQMFSGLSVPGSMGFTLGAAREPWAELKGKLRIPGYPDAEECEAAIRALFASQTVPLHNLIEAAEPAARWLQWWLDSDACECDNQTAHVCGRERRQVELNNLNGALEAARTLRQVEDNMLAAELHNIAEAHRANFDDAESFREWAQSRARHTLNEYAKKKGEK